MGDMKGRVCVCVCVCVRVCVSRFPTEALGVSFHQFHLPSRPFCVAGMARAEGSSYFQRAESFSKDNALSLGRGKQRPLGTEGGAIQPDMAELAIVVPPSGDVRGPASARGGDRTLRGVAEAAPAAAGKGRWCSPQPTSDHSSAESRAAVPAFCGLRGVAGTTRGHQRSPVALRAAWVHAGQEGESRAWRPPGHGEAAGLRAGPCWAVLGRAGPPRRPLPQGLRDKA